MQVALRLLAASSSRHSGRHDVKLPSPPGRRLCLSLPRCRVQSKARSSSAGPQRLGPTNSPKLYADDNPTLHETVEDADPPTEQRQEEEAPLSFWGRVRSWFRIDKARLQNLGIGAFLAYGFVSNLNYCICFVIAWLTHVKRTGMIPFARGQWKAFLGIYAGLWALQHVLRPVRFAIAVALTPLVNRMLESLVTKLRIKKHQAVILLLFGIVVFTLSSLITGLWVLGGFPTRPPKPV